MWSTLSTTVLAEEASDHLNGPEAFVAIAFILMIPTILWILLRDH